MYIIVRACVHVPYYNNIYGVGYGVAVCNERQYQSLCKWNGNSAVPLLILYSILKNILLLRFSGISKWIYGAKFVVRLQIVSARGIY